MFARIWSDDLWYGIDEVEAFDPLFWATACQVKADLASEVVFVFDGARWIWNMVERFSRRLSKLSIGFM